MSRPKGAPRKHITEFGISAPLVGGGHGIQEVASSTLVSSTLKPAQVKDLCGFFVFEIRRAQQVWTSCGPEEMGGRDKGPGQADLRASSVAQGWRSSR